MKALVCLHHESIDAITSAAPRILRRPHFSFFLLLI